ncbi:PREDICTED: serine/arginine repetitive matrix protein 1-like isoform X2 [Nicrophorus vespilloides]|nr:PREDICTED: serine/arginine repetitive matrix protein 1-like isoform X2 [Nicrophorus vespilloides]
MDMSMQGKGHMSEEEDDLELLRMAALQTLKKPEKADNHHHGRGGKSALQMPYSHNKFGNAKRMWGFHHSGPGRGARNGQFNGRVRSTNLIAIQTAPEQPQEKVMEIPKLTLPQDRYCNNNTVKGETKEEKSKFNRYDKSDNDSDSEDEQLENEKSDGDTSPGKLKRANSLEALMQELEYEISGEKVPKVTKAKPKKVKVKRQNSESEDVKVEEKTVVKEEVIVKEEPPVKKDEEIKSPIANRKTSPIKEQPVRKDFYSNKMHYVKNVRPYTQPPLIVNNPVPVLFHPLIPPPNFPQRPLSPLNINTGLSTITMAPLSPRSAAFVMQNREIIERRKKSPRRSFSRSPSPTQRPVIRKSRSPSPRRYPRSASPKRVSPVRRAAPRRVTSPRRRNSTERKVSPKASRKSPPKLSVRDRLGTRKEEEATPAAAPVVKRKRTPTPEPPASQSDDPVLEARKKKFQDTKPIKEGIIRLKQKADDCAAVALEVPTPPEEENAETDDLLELDAGDMMDDIFSDDESENEDNEGRFKSATTSRRNVSLLPFSQLVNGPNREATTKSKPTTTTRRERRRGERRRSKSRSGKERGSSKTEKKMRVTSPIESKKIEIKIRNPAKYESRSDSKRKVAVESENIVTTKTKDDDRDEQQQQPHIVIDDDDDVKKTDGDLRAQLSRKRAERQHHHHHHHKLPMAAEDVQSRLLQNALQGAVYKKAKKSRRKENEKVSSSQATAPATKDKLPIHMRLGVSSGGDASDSAEPSPPKKKKKKSSRILEQV